MSKGSESDIGRMHGLLTKYYNKRLEEELEATGEDELAIGISPAELTAMNNFIKQNGITCSIEDNAETSKLADQLSNKRKQGQAKLASVSSIAGE